MIAKFSRKQVSWIVGICLTMAAILPLWPLIFLPGRTVLFRDFGGLFLPVRMLIVRHWESFSDIPLWTNSIMGGAPMLADNGLSVLHPLNIIFLVFGSKHVVGAVFCFLAFQFLLIVVGWYFVFRDHRFPRVFAFFAAALMLWNGPTISTVFLPQILAGIAALPWLILAYRNFELNPNRTTAMAIAFALAWPVFCGEFQITYLFFAMLLLLVLHDRIALQWMAAIAVFVGALTAVQVLPTIDLLQRSNRAIGVLQLQDALQWSMPPERFLEVFLLQAFGSLTDLQNYGRSLRSNGPEPTPFILGLYLGLPLLIAVVLACSRLHHASLHWLAIWKGRKRKRLRVKDQGPLSREHRHLPVGGRLTFILVIGFWLALGVYAPVNLYSVFSDWIPLWGAFRYPERIVVWPLLGLQFFALLYLWKWWRFWKLRKHQDTFLLRVWLFIAGVILVGFGFMAGALWHSLSSLMVIVAGAVLFLWRADHEKKVRLRWQMAFVGMVVFQSLVVVLQSLPTQSARVFNRDENILASTVSSRIEASRKFTKNLGAEGFAAVDWGRIDWNHLYASDAVDDMDRLVRHTWTTLAYNTPAFYDLPNALGFSPLALPERVRLWNTAPAKARGQLLTMWGAKHVFFRSPDQRTELSENLSALPKFYFANEIQGVDQLPSVEELLELRLNHKEVLVDTRNFHGTVPDFTNIIEDDISPISATEYSRGYQVDLPARKRPALLVWNNSYHPGWRAFLNDKEVPVVRVNGTVLGAWLGTAADSAEKLEFRFEERFFLPGFALTLIALIFALSTLMVDFRRLKK